MNAFAAVAIGAAVAFVVWWLTATIRRFQVRVYGGDTAYDEIHFVSASDGWRLALYRYLAPAGTVELPGRLPVLLCHGLGSNHRNLDLDRNTSMARWLRALGHDVWLVDFRGVGMSKAPRRTIGRRPAVEFDDFVTKDAPAITQRILALTGKAGLDWIGFSMGGMIGASFIGGREGGVLRSLTLIGAPMRFDQHVTVPWLVRAASALSPRSGIRIRTLARRFAWLAGRLDLPMSKLVYEPNNVAPMVLRRCAHQVVEDIPERIVKAFDRWVAARSGPLSAQGVDYRARLDNVSRPALMIAGSGDVLAPPHSVAAAAAVWGGEVALRVIGKGAADAASELGLTQTFAVETEWPWRHLDLTVARRAPELVWRPVADFLQRVAAEEPALRSVS